MVKYMKLKMNALNIIKRTRDYLDYLEEHIINVEKAFQYIKEQCKNEEVFTNEYLYNLLYNDVMNHDVSKFSQDEFISYRQFFFSLDTENESDAKKGFDVAWNCHQRDNNHHQENWTKFCNESDIKQKVYCMHMIIDQYAMSLKFNDSPKNYYLKNKKRIKIPEYAIPYLNKILNMLK